MCCQAGSLFLSSCEMFIGANATLCLCAAFIILIVSSPSFSALFPLVGIFQFCMNVFALVSSFNAAGVVSFIRTSVTNAHVGHVCVRLR